MEMESSSSSNINTYVFDPESPTEMARLISQDRNITSAMGGPFVGISDPSSLHNILDLGCGPGGWVLDAAFARPDAEVVGVDVSRTMVSYAKARARTQQLSNAVFDLMDITQPLDFPDESFDLINARFLFAVLKRDLWPAFLHECWRVLRPGGLLRCTEKVDSGHTSSAAANEIGWLCMQAIWKTGYGFSPDGRTFGVSLALPSLLRKQGYQQVQRFSHALEYSMHMEAWMDQYHNLDIVSNQMKPLIIKLGLTTEEAFDQLHQQARIDMQGETFLGMEYYLSVVGQKPEES